MITPMMVTLRFRPRRGQEEDDSTDVDSEENSSEEEGNSFS